MGAAAQQSTVRAGRKPPHERRAGALTALGLRSGTGRGEALSVSLCSLHNQATVWGTSCSSEEHIRGEVLPWAARPDNAGWFRESRMRCVVADCSSRFSFPLVIGEVQKHSRPAAHIEISRPPPPRRLRVPSPISLSRGTAKIARLLGVHAPPRPSGQYVPTGQKPTQESTSCLTSTQRKSQAISARMQKR